MGWVVIATPRLLYPRERPRTPLYRRLGGPQSRSGQVRKISSPLGFDSRTAHLWPLGLVFYRAQSLLPLQVVFPHSPPPPSSTGCAQHIQFCPLSPFRTTYCTLCTEIILPLYVLLWTIDFLKQEGFYIILDCLIFEGGPVVCPETSVNNYQLLLCNILEERRPQDFCLFTLASRLSCRPWKCTLFFYHLHRIYLEFYK
jgi:hypothetical protein